MTTATYTVDGMTCDHCVRSVTAEVGKLAGVSDVQVDLASGAVTVISHAELDPEDVRAAIEDAGYEVRA